MAFWSDTRFIVKRYNLLFLPGLNFVCNLEQAHNSITLVAQIENNSFPLHKGTPNFNSVVHKMGEILRLKSVCKVSKYKNK